jgi:hypothetical protein
MSNDKGKHKLVICEDDEDDDAEYTAMNSADEDEEEEEEEDRCHFCKCKMPEDKMILCVFCEEHGCTKCVMKVRKKSYRQGICVKKHMKIVASAMKEYLCKNRKLNNNNK